MITTIDDPLFSIVTITRNNLNGLKSTQHSIEAQSFHRYEWIVIDGDSTDGTQDYLDDLRAMTLSEPDDGLYDAMNKGIDRSHGEYLVFMNAGDVFSDPDILSTLARTIKVDQPDFLYGDALETSGFYKKARKPENIAWGMFTHHQAMIYKRDIIGMLRYDTSYKIAADYAFTSEFLKRCREISYCPAAICIFETGGLSQQNMHLGRTEQFLIRKKTGHNWPVNVMVYAGQHATAAVKHHLPRLYCLIRSKA